MTAIDARARKYADEHTGGYQANIDCYTAGATEQRKMDAALSYDWIRENIKRRVWYTQEDIENLACELMEAIKGQP